MSTITMEDDDDVAFQADLARAIAASLEPDASGPHDDLTRGDGPGWNALLAAGRVAAWGSTGVDAGRGSPALLAVEDDNDDFQRQIAAAMAASVHSAEEDRRRREVTLRDPPAVAAGPPLPTPARLPPQPQPPQGLRTDGGAVCCSGGLVLKPLAAAGRVTAGPAGPPPLVAAAAAAPHALQAAAAAASAPPRSGVRVPPSVPTYARPPAPTAFTFGPTATAAAATPSGRDDRASPDPPGPTPACSPCSSAADSEDAAAAAGTLTGAAAAAVGVAVAVRRPEAAAATSSLSGPAPRCVGGSAPLPELLSSSPAKHARTPSLAGTTETSQGPQMKRSRPASDSGAPQLLLQRSDPSGRDAASAAAALARGGPACEQQQQQQPWTGFRHLGGLGAGFVGAAADQSASGRVVVAAAILHTASALGGLEKAAPAQSYSPPERPASAASGCTASAGAASAGEDGECVAATASGLASVDPQQHQQQLLMHPQHEPVQLLELSGDMAPASGSERRQWAAAAAWCEATGGGSGSGRSGSWPLAGSGPTAVVEEDPQAPPLAPQEVEQQQQRHRRTQQAVSAGTLGVRASADDCNGGGQARAESGSTGCGRYTLDLSFGGHPTRLHQQHQQHQQHHQQWPIQQQQQQPSILNQHPQHQHCAHQQPPATAATTTLAAAGPPCGSSNGAATRAPVAPLDLSRPGQQQPPLSAEAALPPQHGSTAASELPPAGAVLRWPNGHTEHPAAPAAPTWTPPREEAASGLPPDRDDPTTTTTTMVTDPPAAALSPPPYPPSPSRHDFSAATAAAAAAAAAADGPDGLVPGVAADGGAADRGLGWGYSGSDRRMLLHQRVWWWLGPGLVQVGRISAIDRRSEPLLYSVRLDTEVAAETQTIIATPDCLFPYLCHGDKVMCRLPPSACEATSGSGGGSSRCSSDGVGRAGSCSMPPQQRRLEEWPGVGGGEEATAAGGVPGGFAGAAAAAAAATAPCMWMCGTLQHCIFEGRTPAVHVLLGAEGVPYSAPYEFVVPVSDAAEGSGCAGPSAAAAAVDGPAGCYGPSVNYYSSNNNTCTDMVAVGQGA